MFEGVKDIKVFKGIGELVTLSAAAARQGRRTSHADLIGISDAAIVARRGRR